MTTDAQNAAPKCRDPRHARHNFELENYTHLLIYTKTDVSEQMLACVNVTRTKTILTNRRVSEKSKRFTGFPGFSNTS